MDPRATLVRSVVTVWEVAIKVAAHRLELAVDLDAESERLAVLDLPLTSEHARVAGALPALHGDPFDRALLAQAQVEGLRLVTADRRVLAYDVDTLDART